MEFLRFGSRIPGATWGCCAFDIIQNFSKNPDGKASIQLVSGDGGEPLLEDQKEMFLGCTYKEIFLQRLRIGTFASKDLPNHGFLAIMTKEQLTQTYGKQWLAILKENGFEFIRAVSNSVYTGSNLGKYKRNSEDYQNYLFGLFRNIGNGGVSDPFTPPDEWLALPKILDEPSYFISENLKSELAEQQHDVHTELWNKIGPVETFTREELTERAVPIWLAGIKSPRQQELATNRPAVVPAANPF